VESGQELAEMTDALARLGGELIALGYAATLAVRDGLWRPSLVVRNPAVAVRTTEIVAESGWFWWPGAYRLGPVADHAGAARTIISVLHLGPGLAGEHRRASGGKCGTPGDIMCDQAVRCMSSQAASQPD
jgi:hypothetical protein